VTSTRSQSSISSSFSQAQVTSSIAASVSSAILSDVTTTVGPSSTQIVTSVVSASASAPTTQLITSIVTQSQPNGGSSSLSPVTVVVTSQLDPTTAAAATAASSASSAAASSTSSTAASLQNAGTSNSASKGLTTGGKTAIAVVVPVVVVALLVLAGLYLWRRRKQRKTAEEARRMEVEEYGYNPNNDPTLPAVGSDGPSEMTEEHGNGYRGWGATTISNRKPSGTTLSGGHTQGQLSDVDSNTAYATSPAGGPNGSDGQSGDPLVNNRSTMSSDDLGALGAAPLTSSNRQDGMRRGPSNASSSYSAGAHSDHSDPPYGQAISSDAYNPNSNYSFSQAGPYGDGSYGGGDGMPVVRDVSARRNTRIEQGGGYQQGNSGISQNF